MAKKPKHPDDGIYPVWVPYQDLRPNRDHTDKHGCLDVPRIEHILKLKREAIQLLDLINAEWQSDPMSVQCFDSRIVERTNKLLKELKEMGEFLK